MRIALGCMRLSTESPRDEQHALDTLAAALDAGVKIFDTARAYGIDERDVGHNEKLVAQALKERRAFERGSSPNAVCAATAALGFPTGALGRSLQTREPAWRRSPACRSTSYSCTRRIRA